MESERQAICTILILILILILIFVILRIRKLETFFFYVVSPVVYKQCTIEKNTLKGFVIHFQALVRRNLPRRLLPLGVQRRRRDREELR